MDGAEQIFLQIWPSEMKFLESFLLNISIF